MCTNRACVRVLKKRRQSAGQEGWTQLVQMWVEMQTWDRMVWGAARKSMRVADGPEVKTLCSQCRGCGFNPWSGN